MAYKLPHHSSSLQEVRADTQSKGLKARKKQRLWRSATAWLDLQGLLNCFLPHHLARRHWSTHSGLPPQIKKTPYRLLTSLSDGGIFSIAMTSSQIRVKVITTIQREWSETQAKTLQGSLRKG